MTTTSTDTKKGTGRNENTLAKICLAILAFLLPPLAVGLEEGCGGALLLNCVLLLFFWIPAVVHALYVICR